jgi:hypothetical protein
MSEKKTTCHDCHGFKGQNKNEFLILIDYVQHFVPFLACSIVFGVWTQD